MTAALENVENLPWIEKYRPNDINDIISHKEIMETITRYLNENKLPHLLFYGSPGTGKTSTILACAKMLYKPNEYPNMVLELNASDDRGIDIVRGPILNFASTRSIFNQKFKLVILDEADAMTKDAQNALRRIIEKYTVNTRFCLIGNHLSNIIPALQSRCTRFRFGPLDDDSLIGKVGEIAKCEKLNLTDDGLKALVKLANGDMRKALNVLQSASLAHENSVLDENVIYTTTGRPTPTDIKNMIHSLWNDQLEIAYQNVSNLKMDKGFSLQDMVTQLYEFLETVNLPVPIVQRLTEKLAELEYRLSYGTVERIQLASLIAIFQSVRDAIVEHN